MHVQVQTLQAEAPYNRGPEHVVTFVRTRLAQICAHVERSLAEARNSGEIGDVDIPALATLLTARMNGLQMQSLLDDSVDTAAALDALVDLHERTGQ